MRFYVRGHGVARAASGRSVARRLLVVWLTVVRIFRRHQSLCALRHDSAGRHSSGEPTCSMRLVGLHSPFRLNWLNSGAIFLIVIAELLGNDAHADNRYGLWIEVEAEGRPQPFHSLQEFEQLKRILSTEPFTDVYCQVYRGGRSWFPSPLADDTPFELAQQFGVDPLREVIDIAHQRGIRVHAWLNALRIDQNRAAPILDRLGPKIVLTDNNGHSLLDWNERTKRYRSFELDTPGIWLDPSVLGVRHYLGALTKDLLRTYPDLDGIHLDMIRFPFAGGIAFPYGADAERRFFSATGHIPPRTGHAKGISAPKAVFEEWKRAQVTGVVEEVRAALVAAGPEKELSAAVIGWPDRARNSAFQDWASWLASGTLDAAVIMNYTKDDRAFRNNLEHAIRGRSRGQVLAGIGAWLFVSNPPSLVRQIHTAADLGADGVVLFSYANLAASQTARRLFEFAGNIRPRAERIPTQAPDEVQGAEQRAPVARPASDPPEERKLTTSEAVPATGPSK